MYPRYEAGSARVLFYALVVAVNDLQFDIKRDADANCVTDNHQL